EKLLTDVKKITKPGDTILFSPAATSFNLFQNEFDRGRKFNEAVKKVFSDYCTLYLVRHGQTDWNANQLTQGEADIPLNSEGIKQAQTLGESLRTINFDAAFSSDLVRAKKTAEILTLERKLAIETSKLIRERRFGKFDGKPEQLMKEFFDTWVNLSREERRTYRPYESFETDEEVTSRFITFLREIAIRFPGKTILIVCHGSMLRTLLNHLTEDTYASGAISNSGYVKLESDGVDFFIKEMKGVRKSDV
ncbi:MAG: histidine phosphatase family protein, partial [Candidatus Daviesbacteria bacterium]|nr:histidine phosphatase family protein [Candidatus Daviesbacteria bacterium]